MKSFLLALAAFASAAYAAPPAAPAITVAATDIRQLQFDITPVNQVNWYELWFRANAGAQWVKFKETPAQRPRFRVAIAVHLLDWREARYFVKACNPSGCSASAQVGVDGEQIAAIGYFKSEISRIDHFYGYNLAVSADGNVLAVLAAEDAGRVTMSAAIYVYRKTLSTSAWRLEARLLPSRAQQGSGMSFSGDPVAISSDGNQIAFGSWQENGNAGAAYLFRRGPDGWRETQRFLGDGSRADHFGIDVKFDPAGRKLVIGHSRPGGAGHGGVLEVYQDLDDASDQFIHAATIPAPEFDDPDWGYCRGFALSAAGHIVRSCYTGPYSFFTQVLNETSSSPLQYTETARLPVGTGGDIDIDVEGLRMLVQVMDANGEPRGVSIYRRVGTSWTREADFIPFPDGHSHMVMSGNGNFVAIGADRDRKAGMGPIYPPYQDGEVTGSVAVYERRASGWVLRRVVKQGSHAINSGFGAEVALDHRGHLLAVGATNDPSRARGIDGDREDDSMEGRGAVWIY